MITIPIGLLLGAFVVWSLLKGKGQGARLAIVTAIVLGLYLAGSTVGRGTKAATDTGFEVTSDVARQFMNR